MTDEERMKYLKSMLSEMKSAYYGGFRVSTDEYDIETVEWAINKIQESQKGR